MNRRPVKSRSVAVFHRLAALLVRVGLSPNQVSVLSAVFAVMGGLCLAFSGSRVWLLLGAFLGIQLRLTCNLVDGLMAVEGGKKTAYGEFFNDFPDRISDCALILGAGVAAGETGLAWCAALLAVLTAYIRVLGASMGAPALFLGPMAKQHRMAVLNGAILFALGEQFRQGTVFLSFFLALTVIAVGSFITCVRRASAVLRHFGIGSS